LSVVSKMSYTVPIVFGVTTGVCAIIVIIILIACSYAKVDMTDIGLLYSHASRRIDRERLYPAGRYYVGVGGEFITYPITLTEMELPLFESRTADGLKIVLQVSVNFKIEKDFKKVLSIYDHFGTNYSGFISRLAMNIIRDASARFSAFAYSLNRSQVSLEMERDIRDDMSEIGFSLESVQLLNIQFPSNFSAALSNTLMLQQQVTQAEREKEAEQVSLEGDFSKSNITAKGIISDALSQATSIKQNADAESESLQATLHSEGISHRRMIDMFADQIKAGTTPTADEKKNAQKLFVQWYWMNQLSASAAAKNVAVGIPDSFVNMPSPSP